jgi:type IV secretory pathway VirB3-like protein
MEEKIPAVYTTLSYPIIEMGVPIPYGMTLIIGFVVAMVFPVSEPVRLFLVSMILLMYYQGIINTRHDHHWFRVFLNIAQSISSVPFTLKRYKLRYWEVTYVP